MMNRTVKTPTRLARKQLSSEAGLTNVQAFTISILIPKEVSGNVLEVIEESGQQLIRITKGMPDSVNGAGDMTLEIGTDARTEPLTLTAPYCLVGEGPHFILARYAGYRVDLFVDGVLMDEEWPYGTLPIDRSEIILHPGVEQAMAWNYAVDQEDLASLAGLQESVRSLENTRLGPEKSLMQYWRPCGHNTGVGDCMPFFDGHEFHIYYLFDRRGHRSKWGIGAHQWAHISTRDFQHWSHHPMAIAITEEWEGSICTGSVIHDFGRYYAFYAVRAVDGSPARLTYAISTDGIRFDKQETEIKLSDRYSLSSVRDPHVFKDDNDQYHMIITTSILQDGRRDGCLAHLVSNDLRSWSEQDPFLIPGYHDEPECADYFEWNGWYYLLFSNDGLARYRMSRTPFGPWIRPAMDTMDCVQLRVPKTANYGNNRRIAAGFLSEPHRYAGELVIRELVQHENGMLGLKWPEELSVFKSAGSLQEHLSSKDPIRLSNMEGFASLVLTQVEGEYAITFEAEADYPAMYFGFSLSDSDRFERGSDIRFEPSAAKLGIHGIGASSLREDEASSIYHVAGLDGAVRVEAIIKRGIIDLCVGGQRTLISRLHGDESHIRLFAQFGSVTFRNIKIYSLKAGTKEVG
ncbi:glycosyl hydrolase [Paenibacillus gansuensis]|uniref:beta-fructofuranosidase n=1 Tax=Paenibacillus gansuensis TaxID=306542 RepID=A0ABW5PB64_9BACL